MQAVATRPVAVAACLNYREHGLARAMARQFGGQITIFDNGGDLSPFQVSAPVVNGEANLYFSGGWNWAMGELLSKPEIEYVWMLNDDVEGVGLDVLHILAASFPEDAAAVTPAFNSPHPEFHRRPGGPDLRAVSWIDWCCPLVRAAAWRDVGGFDARFLSYGADLDFCRRARERGWRFYVHNGVQARHLGNVTWVRQGTGEQMANVAEMERLLREKWGVHHWWEMK
jgi:hypothetical protein